MNRVVVLLLMGLTGCCIVAKSHSPVLGTKAMGQQYYYCASCPVPTKLTNQVYQPLEPDIPIEVSPPIIQPKYVKHKAIRHKRKVAKPKQCIQWR